MGLWFTSPRYLWGWVLILMGLGFTWPDIYGVRAYLAERVMGLGFTDIYGVRVYLAESSTPPGGVEVLSSAVQNCMPCRVAGAWFMGEQGFRM